MGAFFVARNFSDFFSAGIDFTYEIWFDIHMTSKTEATKLANLLESKNYSTIFIMQDFSTKEYHVRAYNPCGLLREFSSLEEAKAYFC